MTAGAIFKDEIKGAISASTILLYGHNVLFLLLAEQTLYVNVAFLCICL